jgi:hypothetical protein
MAQTVSKTNKPEETVAAYEKSSRPTNLQRRNRRMNAYLDK